MELSKFKDQLLFVPLGGSGEIGMNLNLYHYQGKWLMVDLGAGFADDHLPGIDMIVPDITFIQKIKKDLIGVILTHAHEDHLGAVQYLWEEIQCPIYTTKFTANFLKAKLREMPFANRVKIHEVKCNGTIDLDPFKIDLVSLTHSAPEMQAVVIKTPEGNVMHTGDWKFDHDPLIGEVNNEELLAKYGDEGILALVGDSTNIFNEGHSGSEGDLRKSLVSLIAGCKQMVVVTTFASNVARIETLIKAAEACGRKVVIAGRSLHRIIGAAKDSGYLTDCREFVPDSEMGRHKRSELLVISTGCQGEPLAATAKIASKSHPTIKLAPGDQVIFSSKIIPGNEKRIFRLFNMFVDQKVEVLTEKDHFVHVSGHPARQELAKMYQLVRPEVAIPVHGEKVHMHEHAKFALTQGCKQSIEVENGDVIALSSGESRKVGMVPSGYLGVDGYYLLSADSNVMRTRRKIMIDGIVNVALVVSRSGGLKIEPIIFAPGCLDEEEDKELLDIINDEVAEAVNNLSFNKKRAKLDKDAIDHAARSVIRRIIRQELGKNPVIKIKAEFID